MTTRLLLGAAREWLRHNYRWIILCALIVAGHLMTRP